MIRSLPVPGAVLALALAGCSPQAPTPAATTPAAPTPAAATPSAEAIVTDLAVVEGLAPNAKVTSPLHVTGSAPARWYFENQFPARIVDAAGATLAEAPAHPQVSWTDPDPVKKFDAHLEFTVTAETPATLILEEDMPGQDAAGNDLPPRAVKIPIILTPAPK